MRIFLFKIFCCLLALICSNVNVVCVEEPPKPNIVFFLVDDLGWSDIGCYGSSFYETPNVDALAQEGVRFTNAYAACHVCSPTRASILTGKYPATINLTDWLPGRGETPFQKLSNVKIYQHLPYSETTIAEV
ncbi:MAG: sulfatase-like hydrolase/transferase, partial [Saprospiraceae bacterium]|nr:sulfatase-like hydrolase/transferase [Saprospiraceae bacterium]